MMKWIQTMLNKDGFNLVVDGKFGVLTRKAVMDFQRRYGLIVDGNVGNQTYAKLHEVDKRKYFRTYYDKQTTYFVYPKIAIEYIDIVNSKGNSQWSTENVVSMQKRSGVDTLSNGGMYDTRSGATAHYFFDQGKQVGYNAYDPFAIVIFNDGSIKFTTTESKISNVKDAIGFSPALIVNKIRFSWNKNVSKSYIIGYEPRHAFMETENYYVEVFVNGRQPEKFWFGVSLSKLTDICKNIGDRLDKENGGCLNAGNLDGGGSCSMSLEGVEVIKNTNIMRKVDNGLGIKMKK